AEEAARDAAGATNLETPDIGAPLVIQPLPPAININPPPGFGTIREPKATGDPLSIVPPRNVGR
ncbi:MAG: hypothetical protein KDJ16_09945, partial [Hyphomicrobiales bacterium]|nr:hypothetical protein [Hyphomicrobiales bacterium]